MGSARDSVIQIITQLIAFKGPSHFCTSRNISFSLLRSWPGEGGGGISAANYTTYIKFFLYFYFNILFLSSLVAIVQFYIPLNSCLITEVYFYIPT